MRRSANRRSGAGNDFAARIVGAGDEAEPFGGFGKGKRGLLRKSEGQKRASRRRAQAGCSGRSCGFSQSFERTSIGMAEGEANADGAISVAQRKFSNRHGGSSTPLIPAQSGIQRCLRRKQKVANCRAKRLCPLGGNNVAGACIAAPPRDDI